MTGLTFPWPEAPAPGDSREIVPGLHWLRMPLPLALDHINLYLLEDGDGWVVVDTGMALDTIREHWEAHFDGLMAGRPVTAVVATHMHPDHVGLAGWLCERFACPLYMTFGEYFTARAYSAPREDMAWDSIRFFRRVGLSESVIRSMRRKVRSFGRLIAPLPGGYRRLTDGAVLRIGGHEWTVVVGRGHSPEHACLYNARRGLLLSGDQIIAGISSNVSVMASEPEANPLKDWLDSQARLMTLPPDVLVLPAHNRPFRGLHRRAQALMDHHEDQMLALEEACVEPRSVPELLPVLFCREIAEAEMSLAIGECLSHLHLLMDRGRVARGLDAQGVYRYRAVDPGLADRATGRHSRDEPPVPV